MLSPRTRPPRSPCHSPRPARPPPIPRRSLGPAGRLPLNGSTLIRLICRAAEDREPSRKPSIPWRLCISILKCSHYRRWKVSAQDRSIAIPTAMPNG
ncbi:hypothetical protein GBZ26_04270 [Azospirillum formosense]|uniref:Uncharacterized protein n=1 Tax=Azospirillum formosense TaxID=861533 RepID=A0ABX2KS32_9PROT|nr:hypothetical protein [Azospirillum formosense]